MTPGRAATVEVWRRASCAGEGCPRFRSGRAIRSVAAPARRSTTAAPAPKTPAATAPEATANDNGGDTAPPVDLAAGGRGGRLPRILRGKRRRFFLLLIVNGIAQTAVTVGAALLVRRFFDGVAQTAVTASSAADGAPSIWPKRRGKELARELTRAAARRPT